MSVSRVNRGVSAGGLHALSAFCYNPDVNSRFVCETDTTNTIAGQPANNPAARRTPWRAGVSVGGPLMPPTKRPGTRQSNTHGPQPDQANSHAPQPGSCKHARAGAMLLGAAGRMKEVVAFDRADLTHWQKQAQTQAAI